MNRKPKLGQNFLVDPSASRAIADALGDVSERTVLEIGPGQAAITELLAARARRLVAVELDHDMALQLQVQFASHANVEVVERDILKIDFSSVMQGETGKLAIVGNLPYYITSDILLRIFASHAVVSHAILMVQREVADRVAAVPGTSDYGLLSATTQLYARVEKLFTLPPAAFSPPPDVYSTVLRLTMQPRLEELGVEPVPFTLFLRKSFAQKRKTLANNLRAGGYTSAQIAKALEECGVPPQIRAEALPLEAAAAIYRRLSPDETPAN
ncbi:MAG TPA: 16S rRNA (adenine(1518)-N(6)/adenine(1519)-N(6))-dimethyltransferase RsmA [Acidisarcina sp.]